MLTQAQVGDQAALKALFDRAFDGYARAMARAGMNRLPWVERAVGAGEAYWCSDRGGAAILQREGTTVRVDALAIDPAHQGAGQGTAALSAIEDHARRTGATEIALHTAQRFTRLVAFYSRAGYSVHPVGPHPKGRDDRLRVFLVKSLI